MKSDFDFACYIQNHALFYDKPRTVTLEAICHYVMYMYHHSMTHIQEKKTDLVFSVSNISNCVNED